MEEVDNTILEWIFVILEYFGPEFRTSSNVKVMLLDTPYERRSEDIGSLQHYLIDNNIQWQLLYDV